MVNPTCSTGDKVFWKSTTYLAKIALILQGAPDRMLTFSQLMYRLAPLLPEDTKSVEVNIRVCLSSNKCFVKIPMTPGALNSKKNYWRLDTQQITEKMVRRHFRGILEFFPELSMKIQTPSQTAEERPSVCSPGVVSIAKVKHEVKFTGPFSIDSILKRDSPRVGTPRPSAPSTVPFRAEQPGLSHGGTKRTFNWDTEERDYWCEAGPVWPVESSTHPRLQSPGAARVIRRCMYTDRSMMCSSRASTGPGLSPHSSHSMFSAQSLCQGLFTSWV